MEVIYDTHCVQPWDHLGWHKWPVRTQGEVYLLRGAIEQAKVPMPISGGFCLREGPKSCSDVLRAILGINLLL